MRLASFFPLLLFVFSASCALVEEWEEMPRPTGGPLDEEAEERLNEGRAEWIERMHRAAPGVDWREIERANGERETARRNALVAARGARGTGGGAQAMSAAYWDEVGSKNNAGRMLCAAPGTDGVSLYAGSALGGVWKGTLTGTGWTPKSDDLYGGANQMVVVPGTPAGSPDVMVAVNGGTIHVSRDDGASWQVPSGLSGLSDVRGIATLADAQHTIVFYGRAGSASHVYASTDAGLSFTKRWSDATGWNGWLWVPKKGPGAVATLYLLHEGTLHVSTNGGSTFSPLATIDASATRGILTGSEAGAPQLYATLLKSGTWSLHRSTNAGLNFTLAQTSLADFWEVVCASTTNPNVVAYGGVECHRSTDGGASFALVNTWGAYYSDPLHKLHADMMGMSAWPNPMNPALEMFYVCCDGGIWVSTDQLATVTNLSMSGLGVSQYYSTHTSRTNADRIHAGSQDQGYQAGNYVVPSGAGPSTPLTQIISGDYGHITTGDGGHSIVYSTYPGFILVVANQDNPNDVAIVDYPSGASADWLPPVVAEPGNPNAFFFCADKLWRYTRTSGFNYSFTQHSAQDFGAGSASFLTALAFAPTNAQRAYAVNDAGVLFRSTDHGVTWASPGTSAPPQHYFYGNAIAVHPTDALECAVGGSGYSNAGVVRTTDGGVTWLPLATGLPATLVYSLAYAEDGTGDLYAATEAGAWRWVRTSGQWVNVMQSGTPITTYWSVEAVPAKNLMRFGTYGRGIWDYHIGPPPCVGTTTTVGTGCAGSGGFVPALALGGCPDPGASVTLDLTGGLGGSSALVLFGTVAFPQPLGNGCTLYPFPLLPLQVSVPLSGAGAGNGAFSLPAVLPPTIAGVVALQAFVIDGGVPRGYAATAALTIQFG